MKSLSVIIPVYNEAATVVQVINKVLLTPLSGVILKEIILINDASLDNSSELIAALGLVNDSIRLINKDKNEGKGSCLQIGFQEASGDIVLIQDADLEYDPKDYQKLLEPILSGLADVVYGSRFIGGEPKRALLYWHSVGNKFLTSLSNVFTQLNLTDMETGYKVFTKEIVDLFRGRLVAKRFDIEQELTSWVGHGRARVFEVGISYNGRTYKEGKKITWIDGLEAIWAIIRFNLIKKLLR